MANETPARVLVVDDDESVLITVAGILEAEGYKVTSASNVDTAVDVLERERMDLVLTDIRMEGPSGLSLLTEIRHLRVARIGDRCPT
jgi:DNA-binding NtrC family response regulator